MLRIAIVVAFVALLNGACRGDDDKPDADPATREQPVRQAAEGAFAAFRDGKADEFYAFFSTDFRDRCDIDGFRRLMAIAQVFISDLQDAELIVEGVRFEDREKAVLDLRVEPGDDDSSASVGDEGGFLDVWVLEDGEWKTDVDDASPCDLEVDSADGGGDETRVATGPGTSRAEAIDVGETVRAGDLEATVLDVDLDATEEVQAENEFTDPPDAGNRFVRARVRVRHAGDGSDTIMSSSSDFKLTGSRNVLYDSFGDASCGFIDDELRGEMFPGGELEGFVCFQVPDDETDLILVVQPFFSFDEHDRRYLALE